MAIGERSIEDIRKYTSTYTTFSGADIVCVFSGTKVATLSGITWSVTREKAPVYTMGSANPRSFSRGKRGIAGSLIFTTFDRPALYDLLRAQKANENFRVFTRSWNGLPNLSDSGNRALGAALVPVGNQGLDVISILPYYADQMPPFDVTITFANEYGQAAVKSIYGVELLNEGSGASMDDIVIEENMTFVAREVGPMIPTNREFTTANVDPSDAQVLFL